MNSLSKFILSVVLLGAAKVQSNELYLLNVDAGSRYKFSNECPAGRICIGEGWVSYRVYGRSLQSGENFDQVVAGFDFPILYEGSLFLVTLVNVEGIFEYASLGVQHVITKMERFEHYVCTDDPTLAGNVPTDIQLSGPFVAYGKPVRRCYSHSLLNQHAVRQRSE